MKFIQPLLQGYPSLVSFVHSDGAVGEFGSRRIRYGRMSAQIPWGNTLTYNFRRNATFRVALKAEDIAAFPQVLQMTTPIVKATEA